MTRKKLTVAAPAMLATAALALTACGGGGDDDAGAGEATTANDPVTIDLWGWVPNMETLVDQWNAENEDIQINYQAQAAGNDETLAKISAAVGAGNAPCLSQADVKWMTSMVSSGLFEDVTEQAAQYEDNYAPGAWSTVTYAGTTYGIPQDSGPVVLYYNKARFAELGIDVPETWEEFAQAAADVHEADADAYLTTFTSDDLEIFQSYVQQAGGEWWSIGDDEWIVDTSSEASSKVAELWQGMIDDGVLADTKRWDPSFYNKVVNGEILALVGAAWQAPLIAENAADFAGDWAVAPMPQWNAGDQISANNGGSAVTVLQGCEHIDQALEFTDWLNTNVEGLTSIGLFPAAKADGIETPAEIADFFDGQEIFTDLAEAAQQIESPWTFPPIYSSLTGTMEDAISDTVTGNGTLSDFLQLVEDESIAAFDKAGISASAR